MSVPGHDQGTINAQDFSDRGQMWKADSSDGIHMSHGQPLSCPTLSKYSQNNAKKCSLNFISILVKSAMHVILQ